MRAVGENPSCPLISQLLWTQVRYKVDRQECQYVTQEEYSAGTLTTISANFRAYDSMEEGVKGYFEFIQLARYANLKGITSPRKYLETIIADGYATGKQYVDHVMNLINLYNLTQFDVLQFRFRSLLSLRKLMLIPVDVLLSIR